MQPWLQPPPGKFHSHKFFRLRGHGKDIWRSIEGLQSMLGGRGNISYLERKNTILFLQIANIAEGRGGRGMFRKAFKFYRLQVWQEELETR